MRVLLEDSYRSIAVWCLVLAVAAFAVPAGAQEGEMAGEAEMAAEMEAAWQKAMTPGPQHEMLAKGAGTWKMTLRMWESPAAEPTLAEGTAESSMELGGRVLVEEVRSHMMGMPFEGIGRTGYDNVTGKWWSTWTDNMSTGLMTMTGTYDEASGTFEYQGEMANPMTGEMMPVTMTIRHESEDRAVAEMHQPGPDGSMMRVMEIVYERQE